MSELDWIERHRAAWRVKPGLRWFYRHEIFRRLDAYLPAGRLLEIGTGPGFLKSHLGGRAVSIDVTAHSGVDVAADAHSLPFPDRTFAGLVAVDVTHHLQRPGEAIREMARVVEPGGCICLIEPWDGGIGSFFYRWLHHEDYIRLPDPWAGDGLRKKSPMSGNTWIPRAALVSGIGGRLERVAPDLTLSSLETFGFLSYVLTGGFQGWRFPEIFIRGAVTVERSLPSAVRSWLALRCLYVLDRVATDSGCGPPVSHL